MKYIILILFCLGLNQLSADSLLNNFSISLGPSRYSAINSIAPSLNYHINEKWMAGIRMYTFNKDTKIDGLASSTIYSNVNETYKMNAQTFFVNYFFYKYIYMGFQISNFNYRYEQTNFNMELNSGNLLYFASGRYSASNLKLSHISIGLNYPITEKISISFENSLIINSTHPLQKQEYINYEPKRIWVTDLSLISENSQSEISLPRRIIYFYVTYKL